MLDLDRFVDGCRAALAALEAPLDAGDIIAVFSDRRMPVERLAEPAEQALEMAGRLARPA